MKFFISLLLTSALCSSELKAQSKPSEVTFDEQTLFKDLKILSADNMRGRKPGTKGHTKAMKYSLKRFRQSGLLPIYNSYKQDFSFYYWHPGTHVLDSSRSYPGTNIIGYIKGSSIPEKFIVISAHYDHIGIINDTLFNGADDNASGTASLYTIASFFKQHPARHSFIFLNTDAEEGPGGGGKTFLKNPPVAIDKIIMNINIDGIGRDTNNILYAVGTYHYPFLKNYLDTVVSAAPLTLLFGHDNPDDKKMEDWTHMSDHWSFHTKKIPFVYFGEENEYMHTPFDTYENMTLPFYAKAVQTIILTISEMDNNLEEIEKFSSPKRGL